MMKKAVIVGGAGFLGTAIAAGLRDAGREVSVLDTADRLERVAELLQGVRTRVFRFPDTAGIEAELDGADALVHLACTSTPASSMADLARDAAENIAPSIALFQAAGRAGLKRVIFASSGGTVYGNPATLPVAEDSAGGPLSGYGAAKLANETYLGLTAESHGFTGLSLRFGNPYGPYQLRGTSIGVIARYLSGVRHGQAPEIWGDGSVVRDYVYIDDVVDAVRAALDTDRLPSGAYNIGSGQGYSVTEIVETIRRITGTDLAVVRKPGRGFDVRAIVLDTSRFRHLTGWAAKVPLDEGVARLWQELNRAGAGREAAGSFR